MYSKKVAQLKSMIGQIKEYRIDELEKLIHLRKVERLLKSSWFLNYKNISSASWHRAMLHFLDTYAEVYEKVLIELKNKKRDS